jgi:hypothetical protein
VAIAPLIGAGLVTRRVLVAARDVVYVKGIFEASEGLGALFAEHGGDLVVAAPVSRAAELDELLRDLAAELGATVEHTADDSEQDAFGNARSEPHDRKPVTS